MSFPSLHALARPLLAAALAALMATGATAAPPAPVHWQPTWIAPAQPVWDDAWVVPLGMPRQLNDVTLRQQLRTSLGGDRLRLVVSNEAGSVPLHVGAMSVRRADGGAPLAVRFQGADGTPVAPGARVLSDPVALPLRAGDRLEVDLHLPGPTALAGFHWDARDGLQVLPGNAVGRLDAPVRLSASTRAFVTELRVATAAAASAVVTVGDSITDGNGASPGRDQRWPDHLSRRLAPRGVAVLNAGISGNRLLRDGWGHSALARFERDVLGHAGVRAAIVLLGTNDIGFPGTPFAPAEAPVALADLARALRQLVEQAHARGVRVVAGTLPPFEHSLEGTPLEGHYSPAKETLRVALNAWIREAGVFDGVADFDAVLRDPAHPSRLLPALDSGDHLHPGDAGYQRMAEAVDLSTLLGEPVVEGAR